ncbi:Phosphodiest-domain-containing protein [Mycena galericulata]|nr:Phosphodiest-domain-containing protein [Mycena galericulata]
MSSPAFSTKPYDTAGGMDPEERKGLLSGSDEPSTETWKAETELEPDSPRGWSRKKVVYAAGALIALLITGTLARSLLISPPTHPNLLFHGDDVRSNGTHDFKRTVLIVSIDGLRADYLDRGLTPHLLDISKQGLRAKALVPIFPTLTFPNHWALMYTTLSLKKYFLSLPQDWSLRRVSRHCWQQLLDPITDSEFIYNRIESAWEPSWWLGEPMWETAGKAGIITANLMWIGASYNHIRGVSDIFCSLEGVTKYPLKEKLDQLVQWIDLPFEERPQLLMAYEPSLDQAGHKAGQLSPERRLQKTLTQVDVFARDLHTALKVRNLTDIVDVVTGGPRWPALRLHANVSHNLELLRKAAAASPGKFDVYTHETMPTRFHFTQNERIAPIYVIPRIGYVLTSKAEGDVGMSKGVCLFAPSPKHGYDNAAPSMHAMFVAHGPFSSVVKVLHQSSANSLVRRLLGLSRPNQGWHSTSDDTYVMDPFENVQITARHAAAGSERGSTDQWLCFILGQVFLGVSRTDRVKSTYNTTCARAALSLYEVYDIS